MIIKTLKPYTTSHARPFGPRLARRFYTLLLRSASPRSESALFWPEFPSSRCVDQLDEFRVQGSGSFRRFSIHTFILLVITFSLIFMSFSPVFLVFFLGFSAFSVYLTLMRFFEIFRFDFSVLLIWFSFLAILLEIWFC